MMENMASSMKNLKVFMDKDKLVGELREDMNIKMKWQPQDTQGGV